MEIRNIRVKENIWWELSKIKVQNKLRSISDVVELLLKKYKSKK